MDIFEDMFQYVKLYLKNTNINATQLKQVFPFRNRYEHTIRVYQWVERINKIERGDEKVVKTAAIFHDVGKGINNGINHAEEGAKICKRYLMNHHYDFAFINKVTRAIRLHSSIDLPPESLFIEDRILIDADLLDETGAITVLWDSMATGAQKDQSYKIVYDRILEAYEYKKKVCKYFKTEEGMKLYKERLQFLETFIINLKYELGL